MMIRLTVRLIVLQLAWLPCSLCAQLGEDQGSAFHATEVQTKKIEQVITTDDLKDDQHSNSELQKESTTEQDHKTEKAEKGNPGQVALVIITLMMAIVVFVANIGES